MKNLLLYLVSYLNALAICAGLLLLYAYGTDIMCIVQLWVAVVVYLLVFLPMFGVLSPAIRWLSSPSFAALGYLTHEYGSKTPYVFWRIQIATNAAVCVFAVANIWSNISGKLGIMHGVFMTISCLSSYLLALNDVTMRLYVDGLLDDYRASKKIDKMRKIISKNK